MVEVWKKIEGWNGYSVSSYGNVKRDKKKSGAYLKLSKKQEIDKTGKKTNYYTYWVHLSNSGYSKNLKVSRLVALAFIPNPDNLPLVHHKDKNPLNNNVDNLMWATTLENNQSLNTNKDFGCIRSHGKNSFIAEVSIQGTPYRFFNPNRDKCQDWINARKIEVENNLNLTELDIRKRGRGNIRENTSAETYYACIRIDGNDYTGTFRTREKAQKYMDECYKKYKC